MALRRSAWARTQSSPLTPVASASSPSSTPSAVSRAMSFVRSASLSASSLRRRTSRGRSLFHIKINTSLFIFLSFLSWIVSDWKIFGLVFALMKFGRRLKKAAFGLDHIFGSFNIKLLN